jgi:hypothetical protein
VAPLLTNIDHAIKEANEIGHAATLMMALAITNYTHILCGNHVAAKALADELLVLAKEKGALGQIEVIYAALQHAIKLVRRFARHLLAGAEGRVVTGAG